HIRPPLQSENRHTSEFFSTIIYLEPRPTTLPTTYMPTNIISTNVLLPTAPTSLSFLSENFDVTSQINISIAFEKSHLNQHNSCFIMTREDCATLSSYTKSNNSINSQSFTFIHSLIDSVPVRRFYISPVAFRSLPFFIGGV
ncbi:unnamed protein product, partial [Rotaria sp. Silwood2]